MKTGKNHTAELIFSFFCLGPRPDDHVYLIVFSKVPPSEREAKGEQGEGGEGEEGAARGD